MAKLQVATLDDFAVGTARLLQGPQGPIGVWRTEEGFYALEELCPHRAGPLSEGNCDGKTVACPWHGARFDLKTGEPISGPVHRPLKRYGVVVENGAVFVEADE